MKKNPLVSVIIPTRNSAQFLDTCLTSIKNQSYKNIEIIVVDNNSTDKTKEIAKKYTDKVFNKGHERSAQRNYGAKKSKGDFLIFIDSDMELTSKVIEKCIKKISNNNVSALIIPEKSIGIGFWAECKALERSFYVGVNWMEAARFFRKTAYIQVDGYDENMVSGEDWDMSQRVEKLGIIGRIEDFILHNEGRISLWKTIRGKYYYAQKFSQYLQKNKREGKAKNQTGISSRYKLFFSQPKKLFKNPFLGLAMLFMKICEFGFGAVGYLIR